MGFLAALTPFLPAIGGVLDNVLGLKASNKAGDAARADRQLQLDTLHNQISWRVADAKRAGINPLYALGAPAYSYSPVGSGGFSGTDFASTGQDLSRAIMAGQSERDRVIAAKNAVVQGQADALQLEHMSLQNEYLRSQIGRLNSAQVGPAVPEQAAPGSTEIVPDRVVVGSQGHPERSPGMLTDYSFGHAAPDNNGLERFTMTQSYDMKQRTEDTPQEWGWLMRNGIVPSDNIFRDLHAQHPPRPGYEWRWDPFQQVFWQRPLQGRRRHY